jgi:hypothetical protein
MLLPAQAGRQISTRKAARCSIGCADAPAMRLDHPVGDGEAKSVAQSSLCRLILCIEFQLATGRDLSSMSTIEQADVKRG